MSANFSGSWKNQNESTLELNVNGNDVSGRFESGVGDDGQTLWVDVEGRILDDLITFNAVYSDFGTVVTWAGQLIATDGREEIRSHWLHMTNIPDEMEKKWMWYTNRIGADVFTR